MTFVKVNGAWWELDKDKMILFNFHGGYHSITEEKLQASETLECEGWPALYTKKKWCPLEVNIRWSDVWVSPEGKYYDGDAHENRAEEILEIMYGEVDANWPGDRLEELGWIRATRTLMWEVRIRSDYWKGKKLTQKQYDALWDWCKHHGKDFSNVEANVCLR